MDRAEAVVACVYTSMCVWDTDRLIETICMKSSCQNWDDAHRMCCTACKSMYVSSAICSIAQVQHCGGYRLATRRGPCQLKPSSKAMEGLPAAVPFLALAWEPRGPPGRLTLRRPDGCSAADARLAAAPPCPCIAKPSLSLEGNSQASLPIKSAIADACSAAFDLPRRSSLQRLLAAILWSASEAC